MPTEKNKSATTKDSTTQETNKQVEKIVDLEEEQGFRGVEVDPTPNENYTVAGVLAGLPTPETDPKQAALVREQTGRGLTAIEHNNK